MKDFGAALALCILSAAAFPGPPSPAGEPGLRERVGQRAVLAGRVSKTPWQHMIRADMHKEAVYVDLDGGGQTVAYAKGGIACEGPVLLRGEILLTEGSSKRPGSKEIVSETQFDVESWLCLSAKVIADLVEKMAARQTSPEERADIEEDLAAAGLQSVPILIAHLKDGRACGKRKVLLNEGELTNRPANAPPVAERWGQEVDSVGDRCEEILLRIVTPVEYQSPYAAHFKAFSAVPHPFRVADWDRWWKRSAGQSLAEIRRGFQPVIDAYWKSHGVQQVVR